MTQQAAKFQGVMSPLFLPHMQQHIRPYVLDSIPNVLSVGARCQQMGWWLVWEPWSATPYFLDATGRKIELVADGNIPYLKTCTPAMAVARKPAPAEEKDSVAQSDASLAAERAKLHHVPTKVDNTTAAPSPEKTSVPSVCVAQSDASTTAAEIHQPAEEEDIPEIDRLGMNESQLRAKAVSIEHLMTPFHPKPLLQGLLQDSVQTQTT